MTADDARSVSTHVLVHHRKSALKPTSVYNVTRIENSLSVVTHLSEGIARHWLLDNTSLEAFLDNELRYGLAVAIKSKVLADINGAPVGFRSRSMHIGARHHEARIVWLHRDCVRAATTAQQTARRNHFDPVLRAHRGARRHPATDSFGSVRAYVDWPVIDRHTGMAVTSALTDVWAGRQHQDDLFDRRKQAEIVRAAPDSIDESQDDGA